MIYLVGIGPGSPELLTLKAADLLQRADTVYVPQSRDAGSSVAELIIAPHTNQEKLRFVHTPMKRDRTEVLESYRELAADLAQAPKDSIHVFVTLGDVTCYSTAQHLAEELDALGVAYTYVPGISAFSATASHIRIPLAVGKSSFAVHVMPDSLEKLEELTAHTTTLVLMKVDKKVPLLLELVAKQSFEQAVMVYRLGLPGEKIFNLLEKTELPKNVGYLSTAILKRADNV